MIIVKCAVNDGVITRNPSIGFSLEGEPLQPKSITGQELNKIMTTPLDSPNRYPGMFEASASRNSISRILPDYPATFA